jgi:hypothetical protein
MAPRGLQQIAQDMIGFDPPARFQVTQHGSRVSAGAIAKSDSTSQSRCHYPQIRSKNSELGAGFFPISYRKIVRWVRLLLTHHNQSQIIEYF